MASENSYAQLIDDFENGIMVLEDETLSEYIKRMGGVDYNSKADGGLMVAIERFNQGGMAGNKTYHQYHDQYVPMDEESMMYANGGGIGSMMEPKKKIPQLVKPNKDGSRPGYRGPGGYQGSSGGSKSSSGGSKGTSNTGGAGNQNTGNARDDYRANYSSRSIVKGGGTKKPGGGYNDAIVSGDRGRSSAKDFVQTLNNNNAIAANQAGTRFTPYGGGSRPQGGIFSNMSFNPLAILAGIFGGPLAGLLTRGIMMGKDKIIGLNNSIQNSDFGRSTSLADYFDAKKYGGIDARDAAAKANMADAKNITNRISTDFNPRGPNEMPAVNIQGLNNNDYEGEIGAVNNNDFVGLNTNATDMQNYMTDQASFTQPGITPTNLNDFEGIRSIPQLNNNDYELGTPQLNNNDLEMGSPEMTMQDYLTDQANFQPYQTGSVPFSPALGNSNGSVNVESIINNETPLTKSQEFYGADVRPDFYPGDRLNEIEMENGVITKNTNKLVAPFRLANGGIINLLKG